MVFLNVVSNSHSHIVYPHFSLDTSTPPINSVSSQLNGNLNRIIERRILLPDGVPVQTSWIVSLGQPVILSVLNSWYAFCACIRDVPAWQEENPLQSRPCIFVVPPSLSFLARSVTRLLHDHLHVICKFHGIRVLARASKRELVQLLSAHAYIDSCSPCYYIFKECLHERLTCPRPLRQQNMMPCTVNDRSMSSSDIHCSNHVEQCASSESRENVSVPIPGVDTDDEFPE